MAKVNNNYSMLDGLFNVVHILKEESIIQSKIMLAEQHPVFNAHFKANPLLPGFLQIDIAVNLLNDKKIFINEIKKAKFKTPVYPGEEIEYLIEYQNGQIKINIYKKNNLVLNFSGTYIEQPN